MYFAENKLVANPPNFWKIINERKNRLHDTTSIKFRNQECITPKEIADAFAKHFSSVFLGTTGTQGSEDAATLPRSNNIQISLPYVNIEDVIAGTKALKPKLSLGPDKIPPYVYKACAHLVVKPLTYIFNLSIRFSKFPSVWKISKITPIPKPADLAYVTKYRPIALLPIPAKIFEAVIYKRLP